MFPLGPSNSLPKNKTYEEMIYTFLLSSTYWSLLYMKIYCDSQFFVNLWLKYDRNVGPPVVTDSNTERMMLMIDTAAVKWSKDYDAIISEV